MPSQQPDAFDHALPTIPSCALDEAGLREQRARYARLAPDVARVVRDPETVVVEFQPEFDGETLERALAVERECCPFFRFQFDDSRRRLRATVDDAAQLPALDALAHALGAGA